MLPPPPPPANVYPCLDWVPRGVPKAKPDRLRLTSDELKVVVAGAKQRAQDARRRLGRHDSNGTDSRTKTTTTTTNNNNNNNNKNHNNNSGPNEPNSTQVASSASANNDDDVIMKEYGLDEYDEEDGRGLVTRSQNETGEISEGESDDGNETRGDTKNLADDIAGLTYHASNDEDPYLRQGENVDRDDDDDDDLTIKPTDNLIIAGHVSKDESSIEVYVYDSEKNSFYLHHDIIQSDYPCCVRWIGHAFNQSRNIAAAGYMNPDILLWDLDVVDVLEPLKVLSGHTDAVIDICWNNQVKNIIASGSADKHVYLWNLDECKPISNLRLSGKVSALEFGIFEQFLLLAGDLNKNVSLIDTRSKTVASQWSLGGEVEKVRWVPVDHTKFLVSDDQGCVYCYDIRQTNSKHPAMKFIAHKISVTGLEFSPNCEDMLVTASADDTIKVWDTKATFRGSKNNCVEPTLVKEITDLNVGNILSLRVCPNSLGMIAVGGDSKCNSFTTYNLINEKEVKERFATA